MLQYQYNEKFVEGNDEQNYREIAAIFTCKGI